MAERFANVYVWPGRDGRLVSWASPTGHLTRAAADLASLGPRARHAQGKALATLLVSAGVAYRVRVVPRS